MLLTGPFAVFTAVAVVLALLIVLAVTVAEIARPRSTARQQPRRAGIRHEPAPHAAAEPIRVHSRRRPTPPRILRSTSEQKEAAERGVA